MAYLKIIILSYQSQYFCTQNQDSIVAIPATCCVIVMCTLLRVVASAEDWEFDDHSESDSQGRRTPVPG